MLAKAGCIKKPLGMVLLRGGTTKEESLSSSGSSSLLRKKPVKSKNDKKGMSIHVTEHAKTMLDKRFGFSDSFSIDDAVFFCRLLLKDCPERYYNSVKQEYFVPIVHGGRRAKAVLKKIPSSNCFSMITVISKER